MTSMLSRDPDTDAQWSPCPSTDCPSPSMLLEMRILVVEDDSKIASFVVNGLKQSGFAVDHCKDGEEGLSSARIVPYDVVVADIMLPKLDGLSMVQRLRA